MKIHTTSRKGKVATVPSDDTRITIERAKSLVKSRLGWTPEQGIIRSDIVFLWTDPKPRGDREAAPSYV